MNKRKGFTLIELLATVIILAVIVSITIFIASNVIKKAKEKSYQVTINEIESKANSYLMENSIRLDYILNSDDDSIEYQCVTVQNLIDYGYLSNNVVKAAVSDSETVNKEDYVYLERNATTKAITKSVYVGNIRPEYFDKCNTATKGNGNITAIYNPGLNVWSKSKEITVTYTINNLNDYNDLSKFKYSCEYKEVNADGTLSGVNKVFEGTDDGVHKTFTVDHNGNLTCTITYEDDKTVFEPVTYTEEIRKIDNIRPVITLADGTKEQVGKVIPIKVTDEGGSGVNYDSFTKEDIVLKIGGTEITDFTLEHSKDNKDIYNLTINDLTHTGEVIIIIDKDKVTDNAGNGNEITELKPGIFKLLYTITFDANGGSECNPKTKTVTYGEKYGTLCTTTRNGYVLDGWYTEKSGGAKVEDSTDVNINEDQTLYAHWTAKKLTIKFDCNGGTGGGTKTFTYGEKNQKFPDPALCSRSGYAGTKWTWEKSGNNLTGNYKWTSGVSNDWINNNSDGNTTKTLYAQWQSNAFYLDVKGLLDNVEKGNTSGYGTFDVYINGERKANDVNDYFAQWPYGTTYEIKDVKSTTGHSYKGVQSGSISGTMTAKTDVRLKFDTNKYIVTYVTKTLSSFSNTSIPDCSPKTKTVTYGSKYGTLCQPKYSFYTFKGWFTEKNGKGTQVKADSKVTITANQTLYAYWKFEFSWNSSGSSGSSGGGGCSCPCPNSGCCNCGAYDGQYDGWENQYLPYGN